MNTTRTDRKSSKRKKKKWLKYNTFLVLFLIIGGGIYFYNVYSNVASAVDKMNQPISREVSEKRETKVEVEEKTPFSVLLVGVDERNGDKGRTDSMLVITVNPELKSTKILSIPRDTRTELINKNNPKKNHIDKINAGYAYGGIEETIDTVENFLNVPVDYYVIVNMQGFKDIVDAVGGIDVNNQYAFELDGVTLKKGPQHLNGTQALQYARMRKADPRGDFGRAERQREVISKIIEKGKSFSTLTKYNDILEALENNVKTNLTLDEMLDIQSSYKQAADTIEKMEISGVGKMINGSWYYLVADETRQNISDQLRAHLNLQQETVASTN
ncbi:LCP family glycopolymer transferase [Neobacillus sp. Marseille-QA0830]